MYIKTTRILLHSLGKLQLVKKENFKCQKKLHMLNKRKLQMSKKTSNGKKRKLQIVKKRKL